MRSCSNMICHPDPMTGEIFCPLSGGWVECCPKEETYEKEEDYENDDEDDA